MAILKAAGYNAIRTSHNPVSPAFLDACDRLGVPPMPPPLVAWPAARPAARQARCVRERTRLRPRAPCGSQACS